MLNIPPEKQARFEEAIQQVAQILYECTEPEKLENFETIETEVRNQMVDIVNPKIGEFFFHKETSRAQGKPEK